MARQMFEWRIIVLIELEKQVSWCIIGLRYESVFVR